MVKFTRREKTTKTKARKQHHLDQGREKNAMIKIRGEEREKGNQSQGGGKEPWQRIRDPSRIIKDRRETMTRKSSSDGEDLD